MTQPPRQPPPTLDYESLVISPDRQMADRLLLMWLILSAAALPVGLLVALVVFATLIAETCMLSSGDDPAAYVLFLLNVPTFTCAPMLGIIQCHPLRRRLRQQDSKAAVAAHRLFTRALFLVAFFALGSLYGFCRALFHNYDDEHPWWITLLALTGVCALMVQYTRLVLQRVQDELNPTP